MQLKQVLKHEKTITQCKIDLLTIVKLTITKYGKKQLNKRFITLLSANFLTEYRGNKIDTNHWMYTEGKRYFDKIHCYLRKTDPLGLVNHTDLIIKFNDLFKPLKELELSVGAYVVQDAYSPDSYEMTMYSVDTMDKLKEAIGSSLEYNIAQLRLIKKLKASKIEASRDKLLKAEEEYKEIVKPIGYRLDKLYKYEG